MPRSPLYRVAAAKAARAALSAGQHWTAGIEHAACLSGRAGPVRLPRRSCSGGRPQYDNAGTAIRALRAAGINLPIRCGRAGTDARRMRRVSSCSIRPVSLHSRPRARVLARGGHTAEWAPRRPRWAALADWSACLSRFLSLALLSTNDRRAVPCAISPDWWSPRVRRADPQDKGVPARNIERRRFAAGIPPSPTTGLEVALAAVSRARGFDPPPRNPDRRARSICGRGAGAERTRPVVSALKQNCRYNRGRLQIRCPAGFSCRP